MILSIDSRCRNKNAAGEVRCVSNQLGSIFDFVKEHPEKRYNITLNPDQPFEQALTQIDFIKAITDNYTIECFSIAEVNKLITKGYNAYYGYWVTDWETFTNLQNLGVSDIYIDGPLGFQTELLAKAKKQTKIRCLPHNSLSASLTAPAANHFFIRPEDTYQYEGIIDIFDLRTVDIERQDTLFSVYNRGTFMYDISLLIENVPVGVNNTGLNGFATPRLHCKQRCKQPNSHCDLCNSKFSYVAAMNEYGKHRLS